MNDKPAPDRAYRRERQTGEPPWRVDEDRSLQSPDQEFETSAPYSQPRDFPSKAAVEQVGPGAGNDERVRHDIWDRLSANQALASGELSVRVENGAVTLEGWVASGALRSAAEDIAARVSGVTAVQNLLQVSSQG